MGGTHSSSGYKVRTTSYLCRDPNSPPITCECDDIPSLPDLPDLPPCDHRGPLWWIFVLAAVLLLIIVCVLTALYNRKFFRKFKPYPSKNEKKEEKFSVSMQSTEQP